MPGLPEIDFQLTQLYLRTGRYLLNTCHSSNCLNFGRPFLDLVKRQQDRAQKKPDLSVEQARIYDQHWPGAYKLSGADKAYRLVCRAVEYQKTPHQWSDQRTVRCGGLTSIGDVCDSGFSILSPDHLDEKVGRLRSLNGVLDGPACGACGVRVPEKPDEFILNGTNEKTEGRKATPTAIRLVSCQSALNRDPLLVCAPRGGHDHAAVLTGVRALRSSNWAGLRYPKAECRRRVL